MSLDGVRFKRSNPTPPGKTEEPPKVVVEGKAAPNAEVLIENKSLASFAPAGEADTFVRARAGADGSFSAELPGAREGDQLKLRSGASVVGVRLKNVEALDGRPPVVRQQGIRLIPDGDGFRLTNVCKSDVVGEPEQQLILTNARTGEVTTFTLDDEGKLPRGARLAGKPGDTWPVSTSDGTHLVSSAFGVLLAPPADATAEPLPTARTAGARLAPLSGPLFVGGPDPRTIKQGELGDCWLLAACDALCATNPQRLRDMIRDNGDGSYTVSFQRFDHERQRYVSEEVTVTNQVYVKPGYGGDKPLYGSSLAGDTWFPILEKAYAKWKGGYEGVNGGYPFEAFEAMLGAAGRHYDCETMPREALWAALNKKSKAKEAMVTWSRVETPTLPFANSGLASDHAYSVLGTVEKNGERYVKVRNPWASNPWAAQNNRLGIVADKDVLEVPLALFAKMFVGVGAAPTGGGGVA
ncbi:MAG: hypothetical protein IT383_12250 [Deltaproteobacteria bacterium]|nr:hypothetical protein [Deltaproteobacteria bacterium]